MYFLLSSSSNVPRYVDDEFLLLNGRCFHPSLLYDVSRYDDEIHHLLAGLIIFVLMPHELRPVGFLLFLSSSFVACQVRDIMVDLGETSNCVCPLRTIDSLVKCPV